MNKVSLITNAAFSYNRIKEFTQDHAILDSTFTNTYTSNTVTYRDVNPVLTPSVIINQGVRFEPTDWLLFELTERYVSKSYLDNTNNESLTTPEYFVEDFKAAVRFGKWFKMGDHSLSFQLNNIRDVAYNPAGTPYNAFVQQGGALTPYTSPSYFPAAGRNFFLTLNLKF